jgi:hypothetical protein
MALMVIAISAKTTPLGSGDELMNLHCITGRARYLKHVKSSAL